MTDSSSVTYNQLTNGVRNAADSSDRIASITLSLVILPLAEPISDAKALTGRQKPLTEIAFVFAEIRTRDGYDGTGFGYAKRPGGPGMYAHAKELAPNLIGEDPNDIAKLFTTLLWAADWRNTIWCGSRSRSMPVTLKAMRRSRHRSTRQLRPAKC